MTSEFNGVCAETGKACRWDEATKTCIDIDGGTCSQKPVAGSEMPSCCESDKSKQVSHTLETEVSETE